MPSDFLVLQEGILGDIRSRNLMMMVAYTLHKQGLCQNCGYPRDVCRSSTGFEAQQDVCHATAAVDEAKEAERKSETPTVHGAIWSPVVTAEPVPDSERPTQPPPGMFGAPAS